MNVIELLDGPRLRRGDVVEYQACAGNWVRAVAVAQCEDIGRSWYCIPFRPDGSFDPNAYGVHVRPGGGKLRKV